LCFPASRTQINLALSVGAFWATLRLVPPVRAATLRRGLFGLDINKRGTPAGAVPVPEAVGLAPGAAFLGAAILFQAAQFAEGCARRGLLRLVACSARTRSR
jgi:UDP-N-acetylglucosamine--dolichyl-phosphate N-acetylglucosaminephosphotransferase